MKPPIRIAVIGLGWVAQARHLRAISRNSAFRLCGVIDRRNGRAQEIARKAGLANWSDSISLSDIDWLENVDAVAIAAPPHSHQELACQALDRGLHVITEKPFAMSVTEGQTMCESAAARDRRLAVVHNFQFARSMRQMRDDLENGSLGPVQGVRAVQFGNPSRRLPSWYDELPMGLFYDESPHLLYLLRSVAGALTLRKAVSLESRGGGATPTQLDAWFSSPSADYPITMSCNFESAISEWYLLVHGRKALAIVDIFRDIYIRIPNDRSHATADVIRTSLNATIQHWLQHLVSGVPHLTGSLLYGNDEVYARFADAVAGARDRLDPVSAEAAMETLRLQHAIINERERIEQ